MRAAGTWGQPGDKDRARQAAGDDVQSYLDDLVRRFLSPEMIEAMLFSMAGALPQRVASDSPDPYKVLGLEKTAADDAVRRRYRELLHKLHPDTAGMKGTDFLLQLVLISYRQIEKERGWHR